MRHVVGSVVCLIALMACGGGKRPGSCSTNLQCPEAHVCENARCILRCDDTSACTGGTVCSPAGLCVVPEGAPMIDQVYGTGSLNCPDAEAGRCFSDRLAVQGMRLNGATYRLVGASRSFDLNILGTPTDSLVHVALPTALTAGSYRLVASNAAGDAETGVNILQGEPGPDASGTTIMDRLNDPATVGRFIVERMPTANELIQHLNGGNLKLSGDLLPPGNGGTSSYSGNDIVGLTNSATTKIDSARVAYKGEDLITAINAASVGKIASARLDVDTGGGSGGSPSRLLKVDSTANAQAVVVTKAEMDALCADGDGCNITIGYTGYDFDGPGSQYSPSTSVIWGPTCRLGLTTSGAWTMPAWCGQMYVVWNGVTDPVGTAWFRSHSSGNQGTNNDVVGGTILRYFAQDKFACSFADYNTTDGTSQPVAGGDNDTNFYFWLHNPKSGCAANSTDPDCPATNYFTHASRACYLLIED